MLAEVGEILQAHTDEDTLGLDMTGYYHTFIETFSQPDFREELQIAAVFPLTRFYGLHAYLDAG
jgi:hypothetical protein